jgi:hypothetical protein
VIANSGKAEDDIYLGAHLPACDWWTNRASDPIHS